jgi:hypothetical protein
MFVTRAFGQGRGLTAVKWPKHEADHSTPFGAEANPSKPTRCTARFNVQQFYVLPTQCIYVFCVDLRTNSDYFPIQH